MSLPDPEPNPIPEARRLAEINEQEERKRRRLLLGLLLLLLGLCAVQYTSIRYFLKPAPIGDLLPVAVAKNINYPPLINSQLTMFPNLLAWASRPTGSVFTSRREMATA